MADKHDDDDRAAPAQPAPDAEAAVRARVDEAATDSRAYADLYAPESGAAWPAWKPVPAPAPQPSRDEPEHEETGEHHAGKDQARGHRGRAGHQPGAGQAAEPGGG